jgi:hypothetical protein
MAVTPNPNRLAIGEVTPGDPLELERSGPGGAPIKPSTPAAPAPPPFVPPVPARAPILGDSVYYVLRPLGEGATFFPKVRSAVVTEDWSGREKHPTGEVRGPDGKTILDADGKPFVPVGCVNLEIRLDCHGRKDLNAGHNRFEGHVLYDPKKSSGTWHWLGD